MSLLRNQHLPSHLPLLKAIAAAGEEEDVEMVEGEEVAVEGYLPLLK
jgi:hypothetical protein